MVGLWRVHDVGKKFDQMIKEETFFSDFHGNGPVLTGSRVWCVSTDIINVWQSSYTKG